MTPISSDFLQKNGFLEHKRNVHLLQTDPYVTDQDPDYVVEDQSCCFESIGTYLSRPS